MAIDELAVTTGAPAVSRGRQLVSASIGNMVEWFDWYAYSTLAVYLSAQFFPKGDTSSLVPLLSTLAVFAVGFVARPLGGLVIGVLADRVGRRRALGGTILGMGAGSLLIAASPTYAQVGVIAPLLLLVARIVQGVSAGGEYAASSAFLIESAPQRRRGLFSSFFYISATSALLAAIGISALLARTLDTGAMASWGWRIPFLIGAAGSVAGFWIRRHASETLNVKASGTERVGAFEVFRTHPKQALQLFWITAAPAVIFYMWTSYLPTYANITVGFDLEDGLVVGTISLTVFLLLQPVFGALSDRVGRKPLMLGFGLFFVVATVPLLRSLQGSAGSLLFVQVTGLVALAGFTSISSAVVCELFPTRLRTSGIGFSYALAVALFGGTGPYLATYLVDVGHPSAFGWYVAALAAISTLFYWRLPETAHRELR